ncbi:hypothetical protein HON01_07245, partial [Candidatus Woesearchaeota archaeon]|nr:hypothetical protein [Candidatus Woesearchaeota archaeon]
SPKIYLPKVDRLIRAAIEKGCIKTANNYAETYKHPLSKELKVLSEII